MTSKILADLTAQVERTTAVDKSATVLIAGFAARLQAAVDAALENGATAQELEPVQAEIDAMNAGSEELAAAVAANPA